MRPTDMRIALPFAVVFALLASCFDPEYPQGLACSEEGQGCPPGQECGADGMCRPEGEIDVDAAGASGSDGGVQSDAASGGGELRVDPDAVTVSEGEEMSITVTFVDENGDTENVTSRADWLGENDSVVVRGIRDEALRVDAKAPGEAAIEFSYEGLSAETSVAVEDAIVDIALSPRRLTLVEGTTGGFFATGIREDFTKRFVRDELDWTPVDENIVSVTDSGRLEAKAVGETTVNAAYGEKATDEVEVEVIGPELDAIDASGPDELLAGTERQVFVQGQFADGHQQILDREVDWEVSHDPAGDDPNASVVEIDLERGVAFAQALNEGVASLRARYGGLEAEPIEIEVLPGDLVPDELVLSGPEALSTYGQSDDLRVIGDFGSYGSHPVGALVSLQSSDPNVLRLDGQSVIPPADARDDPIEARAVWPVDGEDDVSASISIDVVDEPPSALTIEESSDLALRATADFGPDVDQDVTQEANWSSTNNTCATVANILGYPQRVTIHDEEACGSEDAIEAFFNGEESSLPVSELLASEP